MLLPTSAPQPPLINWSDAQLNDLFKDLATGAPGIVTSDAWLPVWNLDSAQRMGRLPSRASGCAHDTGSVETHRAACLASQ